MMAYLLDRLTGFSFVESSTLLKLVLTNPFLCRSALKGHVEARGGIRIALLFDTGSCDDTRCFPLILFCVQDDHPPFAPGDCVCSQVLPARLGISEVRTGQFPSASSLPGQIHLKRNSVSRGMSFESAIPA